MKTVFGRWKKLLAITAITLLVGVSISLLIPEVSVVGVPIFGFHDIYDPQDPNERQLQREQFGLEYPKQDLENFLDYLARENYWTLTAQELYQYFIASPKQPLPFEHQNQKPVVLTFDDGYKSMYTKLLPILENLESKYGRKIKVTLFVNSGYMGRRGVFLEHASCEELREGFRKGFFDIQSHTVNHKKLPTLSAQDLNYEISEDQVTLKKCIGDLDRNQTVALYVAYPFGADNEQVDQVAARYFLSGYLYNDTIFRLGQNLKSKLGSGIKKYRIPRLTIDPLISVEKLKNMANGSARFESLFLKETEPELHLKAQAGGTNSQH